MIAQANKVVSLIYQAFDSKTGVLLDENINGKPLEFVSGFNQVIPGLEKAIEGMDKNDEKTVVVEAKDAYGESDENLVKEYPMEQFEGINLKLGMTLASVDAKGNQVYVKVAGFDDKNVKIDYSHPFSGKDIKFYIKVLDVRDATEEEMISGQVYNENDGCGCGSGCGCH
ncbi:MAG TPA: peptidylprolyl isomerase [Bacteroidetes bacterium]|nr:peptidylprolyl isomerase [Bacteroidota bacterium]